MKIVVASDSFKGSLTSAEVADSIGKGIHDVLPSAEVVKVAVGDGGEGTVDALIAAMGGKRICAAAADPLGRPVVAQYAVMNDGLTAVLEMSSASGLTLLSPEERNPMLTSTYGTGEMIAAALEKGCRKFFIGIGGSATNDGGMGMLRALGYRFLDAEDNELSGTGASLADVCSIDDSGVLHGVHESEFVVACDVDSPLYGPDGAAYVFAPQKGADPQMVRDLDAGLRHYADAVSLYVRSLSESSDNSLCRHASMCPDAASVPGAGAAGGLGYAFLSFLGARLRRGSDLVLDAVGFDGIIEGADLVITGEGRIDSQTLTGKTPYGVLKRSFLKGIPVIALGGSVVLNDSDAISRDGDRQDVCRFTGIYQVTPSGMSLSDAMLPSIASANIRRTVSEVLADRQKCVHRAKNMA